MNVNRAIGLCLLGLSIVWGCQWVQLYCLQRHLNALQDFTLKLHDQGKEQRRNQEALWKLILYKDARSRFDADEIIGALPNRMGAEEPPYVPHGPPKPQDPLPDIPQIIPIYVPQYQPYYNPPGYWNMADPIHKLSRLQRILGDFVGPLPEGPILHMEKVND